MAKLRCEAHKKRVVVVGGKFLHRGGWGEVCPSPWAIIDGKRHTPAEVVAREGRKPKEE